MGYVVWWLAVTKRSGGQLLAKVMYDNDWQHMILLSRLDY